MAITAPTPIAALPAAPDPNDRATFNTRAYPWAAAQAVMVTETNAIAENVFNNATEAASLATTASSQVALASAAANYKGLWSSLSGALNMPASVSHNGNYWALNVNLANVTTSTPGVSANWQALNIGSGGATETSSAVDVTLTAASYRVQAVTMTAVDKSVNLPSATTLTTGAELFVIKNTGLIEFAVRDASGVMLTKLTQGKCVALHLSNASTAAGTWALSGDGIADTIYQATALALTATAASQLSVTALSATQSIATWYSPGSFLATCTLNISGNVITAGTVLTTGSVLTATKTKVVAMSATQALVVYSAITTTYLTAMTLNVSGTTVTAGTPLTVSSLATPWFDLTTLTSTQAIVVYPGTSTYGEARTLNISGTTVTAGAACVVYSGITSTIGCVAMLTSTTAVASVNTSSILTYHYLLTVSGTTITAGASPALTTSGNLVLAAATVSSTQVIVFSSDGTYATPRYVLLEVSGGTVIVKDIVEFYGQEINQFPSVVQISAGRLMALHNFKGGSTLSWKLSLQFLRVHDSQIEVTHKYETIKNTGVDGSRIASLCTLNDNKMLAVYCDPTGYAQARVLEIGS